jgi:hypothetical protein
MPERDIRRSRTVALFSPLGRERRLVVVNAERADRPGKIDLAALDGLPDQRAEQALAHGSERRPGGSVAPLGNDGSAMHDHHGGRTDALRPLLGLRQLARRPSGGLGVDTLPGGPGETIGGRSDSRREQQAKNGCDQSKRAKLHPRPSTVLRARACQFESRRANGRFIGPTEGQ